jgi:predicted AAA+ superfamily ATPase
MPQIVEQRRPEQKENFLKNLFKKVYLDDIISSNNLRGDSIMDILVNILASSVGSNTNPNKLANTFVSNGYKGVSNKAIATYIDCLIDAFLISKASRPDLKKMNQEQASLVKIPDSFKKIIVVAHETSLWRNEHGITIMNIYDFLLDKDSLEH